MHGRRLARRLAAVKVARRAARLRGAALRRRVNAVVALFRAFARAAR